jgi:hypothetical protein
MCTGLRRGKPVCSALSTTPEHVQALIVASEVDSEIDRHAITLSLRNPNSALNIRATLATVTF